MNPTELDTFICAECGFQGKNRQSLGVHIWMAHQMSMENYYYKHLVKTCLYCKQDIPFIKSHWSEKKYCNQECARKAIKQPEGKKHYRWTPKQKTSQGYVLISLDALSEEDRKLAYPMSRSSGGKSKHRVVLEHRLVMAKRIGRPLSPGETVHHINGIRDDNRPENLELWVGSHVPGLRAGEIKCPCCGYIFDRYTRNGRKPLQVA